MSTPFKIRSLIVLALSFLFLDASGQTWIRKADIPITLSSAFSFTINDTIYTGGGGLTTNPYRGFYKYDAASDAWTYKNDIPGVLQQRLGPIGFSVNGKGYMGLGWDTGINYKYDLWEFDPAVNIWTRKADFPGTNVEGAGCFVINGKAYVGGGSDSLAWKVPAPLPRNDFWEYDPATDVWTRKADLPFDSTLLLNPIAFALNGKGYFTCGATYKFINGSYIVNEPFTNYQYDPVTNNWARKSGFPLNITGNGRSRGISFVLNGNVYCGFGISIHEVYYNDLYMYNALTDRWSFVHSTPISHRGGLIAGVSGGKAFIGGGLRDIPPPAVEYNDWWEFTPPTGISHNTQNDFRCFPNPFRDNIWCVNDHQKPCSYTLYDVIGRPVLHGSFTHSTDINTTRVAKGNYVLKIMTGDQASATPVQKN